jgi:hypothetical protein
MNYVEDRGLDLMHCTIQAKFNVLSQHLPGEPKDNYGYLSGEAALGR